MPELSRRVQTFTDSVIRRIRFWRFRRFYAVVADVKKALDDIKERLDSIDDANAITVDFTREQCRSMIKDMFYKYCDEKKLPLYEYKLLLKLEDFYINRLHGNTFIVGLINKMKTWEIDYDEHSIEDN